jgi:murein DD-endopeptidase MepM/ murein hydrolase activator NlpD
VRQVVTAAFIVLVLAAPALGDDGTRKQQVDGRISSLQGTLATHRTQERALRDQVQGYTTRIRSLEAQVGDVSLRLQTLDADLALHQRRLHALDALSAWQTTRLVFLKAQSAKADRALRRRLVAIYESGDPSTLDILLGSSSLQEAVDKVEYVHEIGAADRRLVAQAVFARRDEAAARGRTLALRRSVRGETAAVAARAAQVRQLRDELIGAQGHLVASRAKTLVDLSTLSASEQSEASEIDALQAASAQLGERIRSAQTGAPQSSSSTAGLIWPVEGPITSPFGWRWGRMHEGIDIGVGYGTPIRAAAAGTVIYCGWEEGYGNLVVIDHGGGLATAYGHQSSIAVACGESVAQGQVIGYVGCTGHCTGPHLHFEVRVDGNPVDPLGYL